MATAVQIELMVDEKGAVSGVRAFDTSVRGSAGSVNQLDATLQRLNGHLDQLAMKGKKAGQDAKDGLDKTGIAALGATERMRLLEESMGVRVPRAMLRLIATSKIAQSGLTAVGTAVVAFGGIQLGVMVFEQMIAGAKKLWNEQLSLTKAAEDYAAEVEKTRDQDFGNSRSIETTRMRIEEATEAVKNFKKESDEATKRPQMFAHGWAAPLNLIPGAGGLAAMYQQRSRAHDLQGQAYDSQRQVDKLSQDADSTQYHEGRVSSIELEHASDARLQGQQKYNAELRKTIELDAETRRFETEQDKIRGNTAAPDAGAKKEADANEIARRQNAAEMQAENDAKAKENAEELRRVHEEAIESGLRGSALYHAQEAKAIDDLKQKGIASAQAVADVHAKFHNEEMKQLQDQQRETAKIVDEAKLSSLTGIAHVQAQGQSRINEVSADPTLDPAEKAKRIAAIQEQTDADVAQKQIEWSQRVDAVVQASQEKQVSGFARIRKEAEKARADLQRQFDDSHNLMNLNTPAGQKTLDADTVQLGHGFDAIDKSSGQQQAELAQKNAQDTEEIEAEAQRRGLSAMKQQTAAIQAEYNDRVRKYQEQLKQDEISEDDFNRRVLAAARERDAEEAEAAKAAREKMAGEFDHFFSSLDHPMKALQEIGDKVAGEAAATMVQKAQAHFSKGAPQPAQDDSMLGNILGSFGFGGRHGHKDGHTPATAAAAPDGAHRAGSSVFTVSQAMIRVGQASIAFGGGTQSGSGSGYAGGTTLLGSPVLSGSHAGSGSGSGSASTPLWKQVEDGATRQIPSSAPGASGSGREAAGSTPMLSSSATAGIGGGIVGGAGDSSTPLATGFTAGSGVAPPRGGGMTAAVNDMALGYSAFKQGKSTFGGGSGGSGSGAGDTAEVQHPSISGHFDDSGNFVSDGSGSGTNNGMLDGGGVKSNLGGAVSGAEGMYAAYEGDGGVGGALKGGMAGMQLGAALGGPLGAAIGAAAGAVVGAIGFGGREKARVYDLKQIRPRINNDMDSFQQGGMDYLSAYSDMESAQNESHAAMMKMGPAAISYWGDTVRPEIATIEAKLNRESKAGRSAVSMSAAQYAVGTDYVPETAMALVHKGEIITPADESEKVRSRRRAMNSNDVADNYRTAMASKSAQRGGSGDRNVNINVHAHDAKGTAQFFNDNMHHIRRVLNSSYGSYGGLADA
jgi:hypothetical protein